MRTLSLLRHAKSSWDDERLTDFERPLAPRGRRAGPLMGRHMREIGLRPDLLVCSPAARTRETAALALPELGSSSLAIRFDEAIYEATATALIERLRQIRDGAWHVLLIGHNPGLQDLVPLLTGGRLSPRFAALASNLPTGALVVMALDIEDWPAIAPGCASISHAMTPRQLECG